MRVMRINSNGENWVGPNEVISASDGAFQGRQIAVIRQGSGWCASDGGERTTISEWDLVEWEEGERFAYGGTGDGMRVLHLDLHPTKVEHT